MEMDMGIERKGTVAGAVGAIAAVALCSLLSVALLYKLNPPPIDDVVFKLGTSQCAANDGMKRVKVREALPWDVRRFTFECKNTAHFHDQEIPENLEVPKPAVVTSQVVK
jgi:hypothetical protein